MKKIIGIFRPYNGVKTPTILQLSETECGVAALSILLSFYKTHVPIEKLREMCGSSRDGCKATILMKVAETFGFEAEAYRVDVADLHRIQQPVIAFWNFNHYVVINGLGNNKAFINDPASGPATINLKELDVAFTGVIIVISPTKNVIRIKPVSHFPLLIKKWAQTFYYEFGFLLACLILAVICPLLNSSLAKIFVDYCVIATNRTWMPCIGFFGVVFSIIYCIATLQQKWVEFKLCAKASMIKVSELAIRMFRLPLVFYSLRQKSEVISLLSRADMIVSLLFKSTTKLAINFLVVIVCLIFMARINIYLFFISVIMSGLACALFHWLTKWSQSLEKISINATSRYYAYSLSSFRGIETVKASGLEQNILQQWESLFTRKISIQDKSNTYSLAMEASGRFFDYTTMIILFFAGSMQVVRGNMSMGCLMAYYSLYLFYYANLLGFLQASKDVKMAMVSHDRVNNIFSYEEDDRFQNIFPPGLPSTESPVITCKNVEFHYNKTTQATLSNINIEIKPLQHVAFVGATGSGKSTLAKILCALFKAETGKVEINGRDIVDFSAEELAHLFAYVSQDVSLFSGSIYENLTLWREDIPRDNVDQAIQVACLGEVIASRGLEGVVAENGNNFSGGEKQRIDIARALLQNTPILILDEATSALDCQTEAKLLANLRRINKTIIFVAHRISSVKHCDQIFVMKNGAIVEAGVHADLLQKRSHYYNLTKHDSV